MKMRNLTGIGAKLKTLRSEKRWSQTETARKLSVAPSTYRDWELGRKIPAEAISPISRLYGISASDLLGLKQEANIEMAKAIEHMNVASVHLKNALAKL